MLRYLTAGESHGPQLTALIEGVPAGLSLTEEQINLDLARRQHGYGRGGRMAIEKDQASIRSGVRWGETLGSPLTLVIENRDWQNWLEKMSADPAHKGSLEAVTRPRPGHADLSGFMKYQRHDVRDILERSSARETAARVAVGAVARRLLSEFDIKVWGQVTEIAGEVACVPDLPQDELRRRVAASELFTADTEAEARMKLAIDRAKEGGDSLGGVVEVRVSDLPVGLGSYVQWDRKLDARLAMAVMSVQAIKGVEIGLGFAAARAPGSQVHDEIFYEANRPGRQGGFYRNTNRAGGVEGGMTNGEELVLRAAMKPIPTLYKPLRSVDLATRQPFTATVERSDVCAVPAALVVVEAVVAIEIANALLEKFGGDSLAEMRRNFDGYVEGLKNF
jgi:chorismate synthase